MDKQYTLSVFTENRVGLLNKISIIFTRRQVNIESFSASETEIKDVYRFTIVVNTSPELINKLRLQIEKIVDVLKAFVHEDDQVIHQEVALYKISTAKLQGVNVEELTREYKARVLSLTPDYMVLEKTGHHSETQELLDRLEPFGVMEFARSGRVAIIKWSRRFHTHLKDLELAAAERGQIS